MGAKKTEGGQLLAFPTTAKSTTTTTTTAEPPKKKAKKKKEPPKQYRLDAVDVRQDVIAAVLEGRADDVAMEGKAWSFFVHALVALRLESFDLDFVVYQGSDYALIRRALQVSKPSELARAFKGARHDEWARKSRLSIRQLLDRVAELAPLAEGGRTRNAVIADYLAILPKIDDIDWNTKRPTADEAARTATPILEHFLDEARKTLAARGKR